jgi:hypothetical protein
VSKVERLLDQYEAAYRAGDADPWPFLDQVKGDERIELEQMIELFLLGADAPEWDPAAFQKSPAAGFADELVSNLLVPENGWCDLLPSLRIRNEIPREKVDEELAEALQAEEDEEKAKVADYYHDMEYGNLDPSGVSDPVLEALSGIYGTTVKVLRKVGQATRRPESPGAVFARSDSVTMSLADLDTDLDADLDAVRPPRAMDRIKGKPDRIDRLFVNVDRLGSGR